MHKRETSNALFCIVSTMFKFLERTMLMVHLGTSSDHYQKAFSSVASIDVFDFRDFYTDKCNVMIQYNTIQTRKFKQ